MEEVEVGARPIKRIRQACDVCRRKKTRCPGEKPSCSICERLRQPCHYSDELGASTGPNNLPKEDSMTEDRFRKLEEKLDTVLNQLSAVGVNPASSQIPNNLVHSPTNLGIPTSIPNPSPRSVPSVNGNLGDFDLIRQQQCLLPSVEIVDLYIAYCNCQPLPLFDANTVRQDTESLKVEVLHSMLCLVLRFSKNVTTQDAAAKSAIQYAESTRKLAMESIANGTVELATLQSLCLLALFELGGYIARARLHIALGISLCESARLDAGFEVQKSEIEYHHHQRCVWSFQMLRWLSGNGREGSLSSFNLLSPYPQSAEIPPEISPPLESEDLERRYAADVGIVGYTLQLTEIWADALRYSRGRAESITASWSPKSTYYQIQDQLLRFEVTFNPKHGFTRGRFTDRDFNLLQNNRRYWGPFLYLQFTYHTIFCLLNHPFLLSKEIQNQSERFPLSFTDSTANIAVLHATWIDRFIAMVETKDFQISDPFIAHCATVAATVNLWYCYAADAKHAEEQEQARARLRRCYNFIDKIGLKWPRARQMARNLVEINIKASRWPRCTAPPFTPELRQVPSSDQVFMWQLLMYAPQETTSELTSGLFHPSLHPRRVDRHESVATGSVAHSTNALDAHALPIRNEITAETYPHLTEQTSFSDDTPLPMLFADYDEMFVFDEPSNFQQTGFLGVSHDWWRLGNL